MIPGALPNRPKSPSPRTGGGPTDDDQKNASKLWVKFTELPRPLSEPHVFKAKGVEIGTLVFRVLSSGELESVIMRAHSVVTEKLGEGAKGTVAFEELYIEQKALELMVLACRQPDSPDFPVFMNAADVRNLTDDEIAVVIAGYNIFRAESGPIISQIDGNELEAWFDLLAKEASRRPLVACSGAALSDLVMYLVSRLKAATSTATSSPGSPLDEPSIPNSSSESPAPAPEG